MNDRGGRTQVDRLTPSQENYIEALYRLSSTGPVQPKELATLVGVRLPSVSRAVGELARRGLVEHEAYGRIRLTDAGKQIGRQILRRDDCLTRLLVDVLGMRSEKAEPEVHRLEHMLSDEVLDRLEVLNEFALSSDAWIRRLRVRLRSKDRRRAPAAYRIGEADAHAGPFSTDRRGDRSAQDS